MSTEAVAAFLAVGLPFAAAALVPPVGRRVGGRVGYVAAAVSAACFGLVAFAAGAAPFDAAVPWAPAVGTALALRVDGLALLLAGLASGVGVLVFVYSRSYVTHGRARYYATLLVFLGAMLGVAFAADLVALFVFWELTSVASFLLIGHHSDDPEAAASARKALVVTVAGGLFLLVGLLALNRASTAVVDGGTWNLTTMIGAAPELRAALHEGGLFVPVLVLVGLGIAAKSAQVPLHVWLPDAMAAPTPVSAFLHSATMVKAGVYLAGRFRPLFLPATGGGHGTADAAGHAAGAAAVVPWTLLFASLGLVTMTVTAVLAVAAADVKELLAYSTASHLGLIVAGFGFGNAVGAAAGAFHMLNHALFKAALFLVAGIVAHETGTRRLAALGGLRRELPVTAAVAAVAGLSMAGLPPFNGFYSKELLFEAAYEAAHAAGGATWVLPALAVVGSVFTVLYSLRFLRIFFGTEREAVAHGRPGLHMLGPPALLALLAAAVGVSPGTAIDLLIGDAAVAAGGDAFHVGLPTKLKPPAVMSALAVGGGLLLYPRVDRLRDRLRSGVGRSGGLRPNRWYERGVPAVEAAGRRAVAATQTGRLRTYAVWALGGTVALGLGGYAVAGRLTAGALAGAPSAPSIPVVIVLLVAVGAALAVGRAPSHAAGVLTLSILGFMIAIFFVLARAPDLALTQLVVETLLLVVFLLVLDRLPAFYGALDRGRAARDAALSAAVGATVFCTVVLASGASPAGRVAAYFAARAGVPDDHGPVLVDFGGGANVVNVILVDFRAFDTLGEVSVVAMAAVAVLTLFRGVGS